MIECYACGANFEVTFEDENTKLNYCPSCGQETIDELDMLENFDDSNIFDDDES
jgi:predicted RNA-binding Zn-ribbon protein involved in translation (DUF1610 family)